MIKWKWELILNDKIDKNDSEKNDSKNDSEKYLQGPGMANTPGGGVWRRPRRRQAPLPFGRCESQGSAKIHWDSF